MNSVQPVQPSGDVRIAETIGGVDLECSRLQSLCSPADNPTTRALKQAMGTLDGLAVGIESIRQGIDTWVRQTASPLLDALIKAMPGAGRR